MADEPADAERRREVERRLDELVRQQHDLLERLRGDQLHFQRLARSVWRVQEDERRRLARDLHDGLGQNLTAIMNLIGQALDALGRGDTAPRATLEKSRALAATTLEETRALSRLLRPQILDDLGLEPALRWLARTFAENHGVEVRLDLEQPLPALDGDRSTLIFRAVQEALTNVVKHAQARHVDVALHRHANCVRLSIADDGRGCDVTAAVSRNSEGRGAGIGGMRDRVRLFSGEFAIKSQPGAGFRIEIEFPLRG